MAWLVRSRWTVAGGTAAVLAVSLLISACHRKSADDYLAAGDQAMQATKLAEAEQDYQEAVKLAPNDVRTHIALGNLYIFEHKQGPAQLEFMKVLEIEPKNPAAHVALGNLYADQNQNGLAEGQYRAAIALDPSRSNYHSDLAGILAKEGKNPEAEAEFRTAIGLDPKNAQAHFQLANLLASEPNRAADAQAEYAQAKALDPKLVPAGGGAPPSATASTAPAPAPGSVKVKPVNKVFLLTHDSPVYVNPDSSSEVVGKVRRKRYVHVTGITGSWLQVKLRNGTVGFVPTSAAE